MFCLKKRRGLISFKDASKKENKRGGGTFLQSYEEYVLLSRILSQQKNNEKDLNWKNKMKKNS